MSLRRTKSAIISRWLIYFFAEVPTLILEGHDGRVNCLLYPFNEATRYEAKHLVSGGADFSVCLWDIYDGSKLHTFTVHGGEVTQLLVPPNNCNVSFSLSVLYTVKIEKFGHLK